MDLWAERGKEQSKSKSSKLAQSYSVSRLSKQLQVGSRYSRPNMKYALEFVKMTKFSNFLGTFALEEGEGLPLVPNWGRICPSLSLRAPICTALLKRIAWPQGNMFNPAVDI